MHHGGTRGYRNHPQLEQFLAQPAPESDISSYLVAVCEEASCRGYRFDRIRVSGIGITPSAMRVTDSQLRFEPLRLRDKLNSRAPAVFLALGLVEFSDPHPPIRRGGGTCCGLGAAQAISLIQRVLQFRRILFFLTSSNQVAAIMRNWRTWGTLLQSSHRESAYNSRAEGNFRRRARRPYLPGVCREVGESMPFRDPRRCACNRMMVVR